MNINLKNKYLNSILKYNTKKFCNKSKNIDNLLENRFKIHNIENLHFIKNNDDLILCVKKRREYYTKQYNTNFSNLPLFNFDYKNILNKNCENVIGYINIPVGIVGPIIINSNKYNVPISTTEGALIASINKGCKIVKYSSENNINTIAFDKGITRAPIIKVENMSDIIKLKSYINNNFKILANIFESTTKYGKLKDINLHYNGLYIHLRINALSGNAMGMNIISKGTEKILVEIKRNFPSFKIISISGNLCTDKKPSAINWINGRGKTVICNTKLDINLFEKYSKIKVNDLVNLNIQKNLIGSALAGSIGGFNSHAANIVSGIFVATGQDIAQVGTSSVSLTDYYIENNLLNISLTMPSLEVATIGGGTSLLAQKSCIDILELNKKTYNENSLLLSEIIASTVLCGELSLMISLCKGNLVASHMRLNRGTNLFNNSIKSMNS